MSLTPSKAAPPRTKLKLDINSIALFDNGISWWEFLANCLDNSVIFRISPIRGIRYYRRDNRLCYLDTKVCTEEILNGLTKLDTEIMFTMSKLDKCMMALVIDPNGLPEPTNRPNWDLYSFQRHVI